MSPLLLWAERGSRGRTTGVTTGIQSETKTIGSTPHPTPRRTRMVLVEMLCVAAVMFVCGMVFGTEIVYRQEDRDREDT
jgi:hypothetical protein